MIVFLLLVIIAIILPPIGIPLLLAVGGIYLLMGILDGGVKVIHTLIDDFTNKR